MPTIYAWGDCEVKKKGGGGGGGGLGGLFYIIVLNFIFIKIKV